VDATGRHSVSRLRKGRGAALAVRLAKALGVPFARRRRSLRDSNLQLMSTTYLEVESHENALPSERGALDGVRDLPPGHENPITTSTGAIAAPAAEQLGLAAALKLSEEISGEMVLERLIEKVLRTAIEDAGAQRTLLIVPRGDELRIEAEAMAVGDRVTVYLGENVNRTPTLPDSILNSVVRTQHAVLLHDAAAPNAFSADPYIARHAARSILCLPLLNRSKLIALLYLENSLAAGIFTSARITLLKAPASQVATSLENAQLCCELTESEAKFGRLLDSNIVGICTWDLDGRVLEANEMFLRLVGYDRDDLISGRLRWTEFAYAGRKHDQEERVARLQAGESVAPFEWEFIRKDGSRVFVVTNGALFEGARQGFCFALDLTASKRVEQSLQQSEAYLAEAQRLTHTGSWAFNPVTGKVSYWSDEMFRIYGLDVGKEAPNRDEQVRSTHPEDRGRNQDAIETAIRNKAGFVLDYRNLFADGTVRDLHSIGHPLLDKTGALVEYVGTVVDVTERKRAEQRLLVQYRVSRILAEAATPDEATPKILQAVCECLGWDSGSLWRIDREAGVLRHAERWHAPSVAAPQFDAAIRSSTFRPGSGIPGRAWASRTPILVPDIAEDPEARHRDAAAREGLHAALAFPILLGSEVLGVMGFLSRNVWRPDQDLLDVMATLGRQIGQFAKRAAAVDELQLRVSMLQNIPVAAWSVMPDGTPEIVNQVWNEYLGQNSDYVNSDAEACMDPLHAEDRERISRGYWDGIRSGLGFTLEARFLRARDATYRWHLIRAVPVRDAEGIILRFVGTATDVHDWRQAQEALRNTQTEFAHMTRVMTMGELTASIAHEVNQPLGAIVTSAAAGARWLATKPPQTDKARRALERIANDGKRAAEVIRRIRALMKRQAPRKEWLDIKETILEVIELAQYQLRRSEILIETRLAHDLPLVRCDRVQLQQVLLNLIINAIEAMSGINERPRELTIVSTSDGLDAVSIEVRDSGAGLDPEDAPHLFEPFYTTKAEGLGIGLSITRSILEAHGGRLSVAANTPHGAVFCFSLPVNEPAP
jgi:PAS domain S-box-containing protein